MVPKASEKSMKNIETFLWHYNLSQMTFSKKKMWKTIFKTFSTTTAYLRKKKKEEK